MPGCLPWSVLSGHTPSWILSFQLSFLLVILACFNCIHRQNPFALDFVPSNRNSPSTSISQPFVGTSLLHPFTRLCSPHPAGPLPELSPLWQSPCTISTLLAPRDLPALICLLGSRPTFWHLYQDVPKVIQIQESS